MPRDMPANSRKSSVQGSAASPFSACTAASLRLPPGQPNATSVAWPQGRRRRRFGYTPDNTLQYPIQEWVMRYSEVMQSLRATNDSDPGSMSAEVDAAWAQGRTLFGGIQGALGVAAMRTRLQADWPLRSLQTTFVAPVPPGTVELRTRLLRTGKSAAHVEAQLLSGDAVLCSMLGVFGARRESVITLAPKQRPVDGAKIGEVPYVPGMMPAFMQNFRLRWLEGGAPYSGAKTTSMVLGARFRDVAPTDEARLVAIADAAPSPGLAMLKGRGQASSLTWMLDLIDDGCAASDPEGEWRIDVGLEAGRDGYVSQNAIIWSPEGVATALSRQMVVIFG